MKDYALAIGDRTYSSWSLRGWLMFAGFDIPVRVESALMKTPEFAAMLEGFGGGSTVPAMRFGDVIVRDSIAMAETLAERHEGLWPEDPVARGLARSMVAEMHAGFGALRGACPMNLRRCYDGFAPEADVLADVARIEALWTEARSRFGDGGPWLFGGYSLADVFYAPVAMRFASYRLPVGAVARDYVGTHLADRNLRQWRAMGIAENHLRDGYDFDLPDAGWPGPAAIAARPVDAVTAINGDCPYSGKPVAADSLAEIAGVVVGFCNRFCRDKTVADPAAWPRAMALVDAAR